jgi:hypothetical protein
MATRADFVVLRNVRSATLCFGGSMCVQREAKRRDAVGRESRSRRVKTFEVYPGAFSSRSFTFRWWDLFCCFLIRGIACAYVSS